MTDDLILDRLAAAGHQLPPRQPALGEYLPGRVVGSLLFLSGQTPQRDGVPTVTGLVGRELGIDEARDAAALAALNALALARDLLGSLDRIRSVVRLTGYVAAVEGFGEHPRVIDGASGILRTAFGEAGRHARSAVGVASLPQSSPVELDLVFEVAPEYHPENQEER